MGSRSASVELPAVTAAPAAIKALDINQDGRSDFLLFKDYGAPMLVLSQKDGPPRIVHGESGPAVDGASPRASASSNLDGPATIVAQNTLCAADFAGLRGLWKIKDQYNAGRNSAQILGAAALDTDGDGTKEIVLLDHASRSLLFLSSSRTAYIGQAAHSRWARSISPGCTSPTSTATDATTC